MKIRCAPCMLWLAMGLCLWLAEERSAWTEPVPGRYPQASTRALTEDELAKEDAETLSNMRNEVFARHGHRFKTPRLHKLFSEQPWYTPTIDDAGPALSELERKNVALIRSVEKRRQAAAAQKVEAAEAAAWAKLSPEAQAFWTSFRAALRSGDPARITRVAADPFRNGLEPILVKQNDFGSTFRSPRLTRAGFRDSLSTVLPDFVIKQMLKKSPVQTDALLYFYSDPDEAEDSDERVGRIYRFRLRGKAYRMEGVWLAAGPGEFD